MSSALVPPHELTFGQDVALHRFQEIFLRRAGRQVELSVQRVELEEIAVGRAFGQARAAVADLVEEALFFDKVS